MTRRRFRPDTLPALALLSLTLSACGGLRNESVRAAEAQDAPFGRMSSPEAPRNRAGAEPAPAAASPEARASADDAYQSAPKQDRPGLGTEWGETRESRVSSSPFERQDFDAPLSTSSFFYNDESGVRAMLGATFWDRRADGVSAARGALTIRLVDERGAPLPTFAGRGRSYVVGRDGARYSIRIDNSSGARFEVVATVDGLDVIDGQPGSLDKRGYLVAPWSTLEIDGFRRSEAEVAAFRFGSVRDSYAAKRGSDRNVGVIGVAVFQERGARSPWTERELERRDSADAFPGRFAPPP